MIILLLLFIIILGVSGEKIADDAKVSENSQKNSTYQIWYTRC